MTPEEFVKNFYLERKSLVDLYLSSDNKTDVSELIADLQLDEQKTERLRQILNGKIGGFAWTYFHNHKMEMDNSSADFIATLKYKTAEQGGRETPVQSGYRSQVKFDFEEMQTSGQQTFIDRELVFPGDTVEAEIKIHAVDHFANKLTENMEFEFREGATVIWTGIIKHIINYKLRK